MTLSPADLERWDPEALQEVSEAARARADCAAQLSAALTGLSVLTGWTGPAALAARTAFDQSRAQVDAHAVETRAVADAAERAAADLRAIKARLREVEERAEAAGIRIDPDTAQLSPGPGFTGAVLLLTELADQLSVILADADAVDAELAAAITAAGDPTDSVTRDGVPVAERSAANIATMTADLDRVRRAAAIHRVTASEVAADPGRFGLSAGEVTRYRNAVQVQEGLAYNRAQTGAETLLVIYDPVAFGGQGRAAIAIGNPDRAARTTVIVPGTTHSVATGWLRSPGPALLYTETRRADPNRTGSVIAWMGYDAPDGPLDARMAQTGLARKGGALLAADLNALAATHPAGARVTVVGHSYGSTTVADAAAGYAMRADDVVLLGSPGTDLARTAADFRLPAGGHVYVGAASTDPVTTLAGIRGVLPGTDVPTGRLGLGADPAADGFGSTRFKAEAPGWRVWSDHGRYFESGSESLFSMAEIAAGQGAELQRLGMTAPHRGGLLGSLAARLGLPNWSDPLSDPELYRPATSGHQHRPGGR